MTWPPLQGVTVKQGATTRKEAVNISSSQDRRKLNLKKKVFRKILKKATKTLGDL
jgi:hypothetical protein